MELRTQRLVLTPFSQEDDHALAELLKNKQIKETYMIPDYESDEPYLTLARKFRELSYAADRFAAGVYLEGRLIGFFNDVGIEHGVIELGYVIDPEFHNRGYATEALRGVIFWLFGHGFRKVIAGAFEENAPSLRVMEKAGMVPQENTDEIEYRGRLHRCVYFAADRREK